MRALTTLDSSCTGHRECRPSTARKLLVGLITKGDQLIHVEALQFIDEGRSVVVEGGQLGLDGPDPGYSWTASAADERSASRLFMTDPPSPRRTGPSRHTTILVLNPARRKE